MPRAGACGGPFFAAPVHITCRIVALLCLTQRAVADAYAAERQGEVKERKAR
jgi:hypothetical protein